MKVIVAGSRDITDPDLVSRILDYIIRTYQISITEIVSGGAKGIDKLGENWARSNGIPIKSFPAKWDDITVPGARIKTNRYGNKYNATAGFQRNEEMASYADVLVALWNGYSPGTADMIKRSKNHNLKTFVYTTHDNQLESHPARG